MYQPILNKSEDCANRIKSNCGFLSVSVRPTLDGYGGETVVELTSTQLQHFCSFPDYEIDNKRIASHLRANDILRSRNVCKEPYVERRGNYIKFLGSTLAAELFFEHFFGNGNQ